ncbi:GNAT family N-acetyltransferase [Niveispirillum sp. SYP-B3756]|uniref:GNAT family N-acetyltransferase n=1 Tax=Niveispirillum sp. SYP-B3756 TaxID=2662178 RepID=UPI0015649FF0|nr:GNAT family N-acetyltransferase [Niveispirillum sp. SYP-B3756]
MAVNMQIVEATMAHLPVLDVLQQQAFADPHISGPAWTEAAIASMLGMPGVTTRLLHNHDQAMGMAMWRAVADEAELLTLGVLPAGRGQGLGRALMLDGVARLAPWGVETIFLEVAVNNLVAIQLYQGQGFAIVGRRRNYYGTAAASIDAHVMSLHISDRKRLSNEQNS